MLKLRRENQMVKDEAGYATGCIASIEPSSKIKNSLDMVFKVEGTEGEITMHLFPSIVISNRKDENGKRNLMTTLCLQLRLFNEDALIADSVNIDKANDDFMALQGRVLKFKTSKPMVKKGDKKAVNLESIDVTSMELID